MLDALSHSATKFSKFLEAIAVREISLESFLPVMCVTFGNEMMLEYFHALGNVPDEMKVLNIKVIGSVSSSVYSFQIYGLVSHLAPGP